MAIVKFAFASWVPYWAEKNFEFNIVRKKSRDVEINSKIDNNYLEEAGVKVEKLDDKLHRAIATFPF